MKNAGSQAISQAVIKPDYPMQSNKIKNVLRAVLMYAAMAVGVTVGGVAVGALIVAPAVSRSKPLLERALSKSTDLKNAKAEQTETNGGGSVGQADGDGMSASVARVEPFQPMTDAIASAKELEAKAAAVPAPRGMAALKREAAALWKDVLFAAGRVPKIFWVYADVGAVLAMAGLWFWRRRRHQANSSSKSLSNSGLRHTPTPHSSLPTRQIGKNSRTPKAVAALAEAGNSPADIARRTGLPHDAVAMLLSLGSFGGRQLQPPTA